jgi:predicted small secreted protein
VRQENGSETPMTSRIVLAIFAAATLAGCNTVQGVGRDMTAAGHAVSETASDVQQRM